MYIVVSCMYMYAVILQNNSHKSITIMPILLFTYFRNKLNQLHELS